MQTVFTIIAFAFVLCLVLSFIYRLIVSDADDSDESDIVAESEQDLTDMTSKQAVQAIFLSNTTPRKNQQIVSANVFADKHADNEGIETVNVGYSVKYAKSDTAVFCERVSFVLDRINVPQLHQQSEEDGQLAHRMEKLDDILSLIAEKSGFQKETAVIYE